MRIGLLASNTIGVGVVLALAKLAPPSLDVNTIPAIAM